MHGTLLDLTIERNVARNEVSASRVSGQEARLPEWRLRERRLPGVDWLADLCGGPAANSAG